MIRLPIAQAGEKIENDLDRFLLKAHDRGAVPSGKGVRLSDRGGGCGGAGRAMRQIHLGGLTLGDRG